MITTDLNSGDFVRITHNGSIGVGYIYDNGSDDEPWLAIGISWAKGGTSNTSVKDALDSGATFEKIIEASPTWETNHKPFVDEWGNTDWRDTGEMGG